MKQALDICLSLTIFMIMIALVRNTEEESQNFDVSKVIKKESFSIDLAAYFIYFASYGYCTVDKMINNNCCKEFITNDKWELEYAEPINYKDYNMAVLRNDEYNKIVFTFPGTRDILQLVDEGINSKGVSLEGYQIEKIMDYFFEVYSNFHKRLHEMIGELNAKYPNHQYIFTGHSLGGSIATIVAMESVKYGKLRVTENSPVLITYGQPRTGNDIFSNEVMKLVPVVFRIVRQGDPVPSILFCKANFLSSTCEGTLPDFKFDKDYVPDNLKYNDELNNYFPWHIAGLKLFANDMTSFKGCGEEFGENHPDKSCLNFPNLDVRNHRYFGMHCKYYCSQN